MSASERVVFQVDAIGNFSNVIGEVNKLQSRLQSLKLPSSINTKFESSLKDIMNKYEQFQTLASKGVRTKGDFSKLNSSAKDFENSLRSLKKELNGVTEQKLRVQVDNLPEVKALEQEIKRLQKTYTELNSLGTNKIQGIFGADETQKIRTLVGESKKLKPALENAFAAIKTGNIDDGLKALDEFEKDLNRINGGALNVFQKANPTRKADIQKYINEARRELILMGGDASEAKAKLEQLKADRFTQMASGISTARAQLDNLGASASKTTREILNTARATQNMESQLTGLQTQANYFFGLQNMIQLFRRGLSDTIQTVRDLDKAMTDTAVVTDMTVSDLWAQLPDYTKLANKLGATTQGAYETMTLYYQQGLNKEETFEIGEETMKMARIAGLDYAQTTNMMTAALRGFNMELNQTSAKRVNDVYSELAAITASDTRELGLAMERTASIAHSANMDFGNTTAFLAQMIETTREAPENLGTAMKTIIARFQELKENPYQISEVEGEEVDFNRVDKALKSIGVDLMDNRDKFRDLDDVFLDISSKWDGLSQTQQRYVATIAAGARQQSRFLAMVQNYDRLKELTDAAANSEGASDVQFSKTLDSMEAKLNKLNNAWDQFAMGITNNELIKKGTGALVKILDVVNKFEAGVEGLGDKIGGVFGDIFKSITSFTGLLLGFKGLGKLTDIGIGMLGGMLGMGKGVGASMFGGMSGIRQSTNMAQAKAISNPIVTAINRLSEAILKKPIEQDNENIRGVGRQEFKNRNQQLRDMTMSVEGKGRDKKMTAKSFSVKDFGGVFEDLNREEQAALYRGSKGTREAIQKSFSEGIAKLNVSDEATHAAERFYTDLDYAMANGSHQVQSGLTKAFDPVKLGRAIGGDAGKEIEKAALERRKNIIKQGQQLGFNGQELKKYWQSREADLYGGKIKLDDGEMKANTSRLSGMTSAVNGLGSSFMQLGMTMQSIGFEKLGGAISIAGSSLLSMGMMAETASHGLKVLKTEAAGVYSVIAGAAPALAIAGGVLAAAFVGYKIKQKQIKEIRKSGKEVVDTYEETTKSVQENLNKLDKIQPDWDKWAAGVDANGNNVSLGTEEYQDYKKAVKEIVKMHPELVKGYTAEGEAIIDNNHALQEAIKLENKTAKDATKKYLEEGQKIIDRRNSTKRWQKGQENKVDTANLARGAGITAAYTSGKSVIVKDAAEVAKAIQKVDGGDKILEKWGITFDKLGNMTEESINIIRDHGGDIQNELVKSFDGKEITDAQQKLLNSSNDAIAQLGQDFKGIEDVSKETFDALKVHATDQGIFDVLDGDLIAPYEKALSRLAEKDLSWGDMQKEADALGKKYQDLGGALQDFKGVQDGVEKAQEKFGQNLDAEGYKNEVNNLTKPLDTWIKKLKNSADEADRILGEYLENQKAKMLDISESVGTIGDAFNTMSGSMAAAQTVYENWQKQNEGGDLYTPAEEMKKMYEEVHDGVDNLDKGSNQYWSAMEAIVGSDNVWDHSKKEVEDYAKTVMTFFEDGKKGATNFKNYLASDDVQNIKLDTEIFGFKKGNEPFTVSDFIKKVDGGVDLSGLSELGSKELDAFGEAVVGSAETWAAAMMKASQHYNVIFGSAKQMREAIGASEYALAGEEYDGENRHLYFRRDQFREEGRNQNLNKDQIERLEKKVEDEYGVILTDGVKEMSKKIPEYIKDWGITNEKGQTDTSSFIKYLDKLQYNQDEISQLYNQAIDDKLISDANKVDFNEEYKKAIASNRDPSVAAATNIDSNVGSILGVVQSIAVAMGVLTAETKNNVEKGIEESKEAASDLKNGKEGLSYEDARARLYAEDQKLRETKAQLEAGQLNYEEGSPKWEEYAEQIGLINDQIKNNHAIWKSMTEDAYYKAQELDSYSNLIQTKAGEKALSYYNQNGLGNTNLENRNANAIEWGKDPSKGSTSKDWKNLQTWQERFGPINKEDFTGTKSTYYSMADHYGKTGKGQGVELAFTPIFQTDDQKLHVLAEDTADKYLNAIVEASTRKDGTVDIQRLMGLDQEGLEGFTAYGEQIHGLLMGAFTGDGAASAAGAMGQLEHIFSEVVPSGITGFTELSTAASQVSTDATALGNNITKAGGDGEAAASSMKMAFIEANKDGIAKLAKESPGQFQTLTKQLGLTEQELDKIADIHPEIDIKAEKLEDTDKKLKDLEGKDHKIKATVESPSNKLPSFKGGDKDAQGQYKEFLKKGVPQETEQDLSVKYKPKIDNEGDVKNTLLSKLKKIFSSVESKPQTVKVKTNTQTSNKTETKTKETKTQTINYKSGKLPTIKGTTSIGLHYKLKKQDDPKKKSANVNYTLGSQAEPKDKHAKVIYDQKAKGQNNKLPNNSGLSFGSAARGVRGTLGPKNKGGLTLTGEEGFEIAWLPGENRSTILGANGPQMLNLPKDAVVYNHKQSKDILKRKSVPAGSMADGDMTDKGSSVRKKITRNPGKRREKGSTKGKDNSKGKDDKKNTKTFKKILQTAGKINSWWWNMTKKVESTQRRIDKLSKQTSDLLKRVGVTIKSITGTVSTYIKRLKQQITLNKQMSAQASKQLSILNTGKTSKATKKAQAQVRKDEKRLAKARKTKTKKDDKKAQKQLAKDRKKLRKTQTGYNWADISYEVTEQKKNKKGKITKTKKTKKARINLAPYIYYDSATGAYVVDYKKINKIFSSNKSKAKGVMEAAQKRIEDYTGKRNTAEDNITKAEDALKQLSNDIYENFYQWEKDITEIYLLSQKLETITKKLSISGTRAELEFSKLEAGVSTTAQSLPKITKALQDERDLLMQQAAGKAQNVTEAQNEFIESTQFPSYIRKYINNLKSTEAKDEYEAAKLAFDLLKDVNLEGENFDYSKAIQALDDNKYNKETNDKIKAVLDKIFEKQSNYLESINDAYEVQKEIYEKMEEYQSFISEFEGDLISGIEEQTEDQINRLDKINSSLTKAYKELLDEVKNKLNERRKQEDNARTESDIAKKQQRLAALRADTAGGHQVEIAQLEKEIAEAQQSYQRSLEDQLLDRLQQQGDEAEKQRQRQIDLLEAQKEIAKQTGTNLEQVKKWLEDYQGNYDLIRNAWLANKNYDEATAGERTQLEQEFESEWSKYLAYRAELPGYEKIVGNLEEIPNTTETAVNTLSSIEESVNKIADNIVSLNTDRNVATLREQGATANELRQAGYSASDLLGGGYTVDQLINGGFKRDGEKGLEKAGIKTADIKKVKDKISAKTLRAAGYSAAQAHYAGYTDQEIKKGGYAAAQFKWYQDYIGNKGTKGVNAAQKAGYTNQQIAKVYGSTQAMTTLNMSGKKTQAITKVSLPTLQKIVNKSSKDKAVQTDLAGVKTKIDINGKKKGGSTSGTVNASGRTITANRGSTIYSQKINTKTGKGTGKVTKTTIDKLTTANFKYNKKEATDALVSAIRNQKVGSKINKGMASLVKAAGIAGKTYKLSNGVYGSIGSDGKIYYNKGKEGVQIWNAAAGKLGLEKYNLANFKKKANYKNVGREYAQVLKARKVAGYKTGGLATQTGPAWLDGTPSKPELVLNSQDTKNFLTLKDVLSNALSSTKSVENTYGGDTSYEININVDHLNNDYDVDRVAERVKRIIVKDAGYRNVTQVRNFR